MIQPGVAFSVYSDGLDVVFDISRGETSVCNDILALCGLIGDKSREVVVGSNECIAERVWHVCEIEYRRIHIDIDTTVETIYGKQQGGRKGHNTKNRGKKGFRPVLGFIEETREYIAGKLRVGETMGERRLGSLSGVLRNTFLGA